MMFKATGVKDAWLIEPERKADARGSFARIWSQREFEEAGPGSRFVSLNTSHSYHAGTIRGLHYQVSPDEEAKLVWCVRGRVFDVLVDLRPESETFCRWASFDLRSGDDRLLYIPPGCAHGLQTVEDDTVVVYASSAFYRAESERGICWDDPFFVIRWPIQRAILSEKDSGWPRFDPGLLERRPASS